MTMSMRDMTNSLERVYKSSKYVATVFGMRTAVGAFELAFANAARLFLHCLVA
jgi:hypothetical protein